MTHPPNKSVRSALRRSSVGSVPADCREMLTPPENARRVPRIGWLRVRLPVALAVSLVVLLGGALASASFRPDSGSRVAAAAQPGPPPVPIPTVDPCDPDSPLPICRQPTRTTTPPTSGLPLPTEVPTLPPCDPALPLPQCSPTGTTTPCSGEGCIPQPGPTSTPPTGTGTGQPGPGEQTGDDCGITDIGACITEAVDGFFQGIVTDALNPLLDLLSKTLLTTPTPDSLPRVGELWDNSWQILLVSYGLLVLVAGVIAMGYQTVQTRHSIKELAPRLVIGFLVGALSLWAATKGIEIANALVAAIMGGGIDASSAGATLRNMVMASLNGGTWIILIGVVLAGILVALLVTYVVRVALTIILIAGAPLALMFHALPQTEGIAYAWWKAYGGCLVIQLAQSLTLTAAMRVFFAPGGFSVFGPTVSGLVNLLVALALMYILFKIPFWVLSSVRGGGGLVGSLVKGFLAYKTFGLLGGRGGSKSPKPQPSGGRSGGGNPSSSGSPSPYAAARATADGQYVLPLPGLRRTRPAGRPKTGPVPKSSGPQGRQLALPLGDDWPENKPVLGRDGQYRLPLDVQRTPPSPASATEPGSSRRIRTPVGRQLELPLDPYRSNRPNRAGQYPLPIDGVRRVPRPATPPAVPRPSGPRTVQPELPFDPYKGNRAGRGGQYPLPLDGVHRVPAPAPPPAAPPRPAPRPGRQLKLPLDLPKPAKPPTTPVFRSPPPGPKHGGKTP